jgi:hypothetical protein
MNTSRDEQRVSKGKIDPPYVSTSEEISDMERTLEEMK